MALPRDAMGLSAVCDCDISGSYSLTNFVAYIGHTLLLFNILKDQRFHFHVMRFRPPINVIGDIRVLL